MDAAIFSRKPFNNGENDMAVKTVTISLLICVIAGVHIFYHGSELGFHLFHQQLFYIPLVLASFWFGLRICIPTAILISLLYSIPMIFPNHEAGSHIVAVTQIFLYLLVSFLIGWLSDREREQQSKLFQNERATALGKAASALSFEVQDIVKQIESIHHREEESQSKKDDMAAEINRLKKLLGALSQFSSPLGDLTLSHDLNELILQRLPTYHQNAAAKGVRVVVDLDKGGCPSMVTTESIPMIIDALVENAIDFSEKGQSIVLRSKRGGDFCIFEVSDSGPGVSKENEAKLFKAFFTTKPDGYGISLSAGNKVLGDLGGDLVYRPNLNGGAIFEMRIPRESSGDNIGGYVNSALPNSSSK